MKKISFGFIAICIFCFNANAQTPTAVKGYKVEVITPESIAKDHDALTKTVTIILFSSQFIID